MDNATSINMVAGAVSPTGLPSNLPRVSTVANGARSLAIDSAGALFLSKDRGQTWKPVPPKWTGRAAHVGFNAAAKPAAFELTTDSGATWTSRDGQSWKLEKPQP